MSRLKIHQLVLFLLCTSLTIAQENPWEFEEGKFIYFPKEDGFVIIDENYEYFTTDAISFEKREHAYNLSINDLFLRFPHSKRTLFYHAGGGIVYEHLGDSLIRLDNSYQWNSRYGAAPFVMNDTLFLYGGYGELNYAYNTIYFDETRKGWFLADIEIPNQDQKKAVFVEYDSLRNSLNFLFEKNSLFEVQRNDLSNKNTTITPIQEIPYYDQFSYTHVTLSDSLKNVLYNNNNTIYSFDLNRSKFMSNAYDLKQNKNRYILDYNSATKEFLVHDMRHNKLEIIPFKWFFGQNTETVVIEEAPSSNQAIYIVLAFALLAALILRNRRTKASSNVFDCIVKNKQHISRQISTNQNIMLDLILEKHPNWITLPDLSVDLYEHYSHDSKQKKIRKDLKEIEKIILQECKLSDKTIVFHFDQSPDDKRIKTIELA